MGKKQSPGASLGLYSPGDKRCSVKRAYVVYNQCIAGSVYPIHYEGLASLADGIALILNDFKLMNIHTVYLTYIII